jgi:chromate transporter
VVGVIVNLEVYFAWHVIWPGARLDIASAAIARSPRRCWSRRKSDVIPVIARSGRAGSLLWMAGLQRAV